MKRTILNFLEECRDIAGPEEMTDYDLFSAGGYCPFGYCRDI
jgi:hypothetical protein